MSSGLRIGFVVLFALCTTLAAATAPIAGAPPAVPAAYYGTLTVNGDPAPAGMTVVARIDGEVRGSLTTERPGRYGGAGAFDPKLQVDGSAADVGATVQFYVNGVAADQMTTWASGDVAAVDLTASGVPVRTPTRTPTPQPQTPTRTPTSPTTTPQTPTQTPVSPQTPTPTATPPTVTPTPQTPTATPTQTPVSPQNPPSGRVPTGPSNRQPSASERVDVSVSPATSGDGVRVSVDVSNARANQPVVVDTSTGSGSAAGLGLEQLSLTPLRDGNFTLETSVSDAPDPTGPSFPGANASEPLGFLTVDHSIPDADIGEVRFVVRVARARLDARGLTPADVALYRYTDRWTALSTTLAASTADAYVFEVVSPGLSVFAIAPAQAVLSVDGASIASRTVAPGASVTVDVVLENTGARDGSWSVPLVVDGDDVTVRTVSLSPGERRTIMFTHRFDDTGTYDVAVAGIALGSVSVAPETTSTAGPDASDDGSVDTDTADTNDGGNGNVDASSGEPNADSTAGTATPEVSSPGTGTGGVALGGSPVSVLTLVLGLAAILALVGVGAFVRRRLQ